MKINKFLAVTLALVLVAGFGTPAFADQEGLGDGYDDPITLPNNIPQVAPIVDCSVDSGDVVAFETSRGVSTSIMTLWESDLQANGFVVREFDITTQGIPDCIVKMVIKSTTPPVANCASPAYTPAESTQIVNWVDDGGALLLLNDNSACGPATFPITTALGETAIPAGFNALLISGTNWDPTNPSTLWNGVADWNWFSGSNYQPSVDTVATHGGVFPMGDPIVIAKEIGDGCALIIGESDWTSDPFIISNDNQLLALNTLLFLNECIDSDFVGGEFLQIDSTALLLAAAQSPSAWVTSLAIAALGIGAYVFTRNQNNMRNIKVILRDYLDRL